MSVQVYLKDLVEDRVMKEKMQVCLCYLVQDHVLSK